jgi:zinc transport system substrate-binding protein
VKTIYYETLVDPKVAETVATETGANTAVLDPIEGLVQGSSQDYLSIMRTNLSNVKKGQGCK